MAIDYPFLHQSISIESFLIETIEETVSLHLRISLAALLKSDFLSATSEDFDGKFRF